MRSPKQRLQDLIDQEPAPGTQFAAKVCRASVRSMPSSSSLSIGVKQSQSSVSSASNFACNESLEIVGDVMERRRSTGPRRRQCRKSNMEPPFSERKDSQCIPVNGFPSLKQRNIGTFLLSRTMIESPSQNSSASFSDSVCNHSKFIERSSYSIQEQSSKEAQAILEQMSLSEIREAVDELHSLLKPDSIRFLKQRGFHRKMIPVEEPHRHASRLQSCGDTSETVVSSELDPMKSTSTTCIMESDSTAKEQMSIILSSIQTYSDLDTAYDNFMDVSHTYDATTESTVYTIKDEYNDDEKFEIACKLLRSSSPHQTIWAARIVCDRLKCEVERNPHAFSLLPIIYSESSEKTCRKSKTWPFPVLLPVSLRCLLDSQSSLSRNLNGGLLLTTYILQSLYMLLQLRACADHVVYFPLERNKDFYQAIHLDDAVPGVPVRLCYASAFVEPVVSSSGDSSAPPTTSCTMDRVDTTAAAYWTSSSTSASAMADGQSFLRDPMWTYLSTMRIIPRLADILQLFRNGVMMPLEMRTSMCGILAMIGQRSLGSASGIVHHPTLIDDLLKQTIVRQNNSARYDSRSVIPLIYLLCTLVRQSRVVAENIHHRVATEISPVLLHLLAPYSDARGNLSPCSKTFNQDDFLIQQWSFILWRTLLRYGLGLNILPTIFTLAARHITLGASHANESVSLAPEMYSCFAIILYVTSQQSCGLGIVEDTLIDSGNIYSMISSPWRRRAIDHLRELVQNDTILMNREGIRLATGIFKFWDALLGSLVTHGDFENITDDLFADIKLLISALDLTMSKSGMSAIVSSALSFARKTNYSSFSKDASSLKLSTRDASFLEALIGLTSRIKSFVSIVDHSQVKQIDVNDLEIQLAGYLLHELNKTAPIVKFGDLTSLDEVTIETAQRHRLNRIHAVVVSFLCRGDFDADLSKLKAIAFAVIGRLGSGEEHAAYLLFSIEELFCHSHSAVSCAMSSLVSQVLCRELLLGRKRQVQFDHNCGLNADLRISDVPNKKFVALQTLLCDAGQVTVSGSEDSVYFLPLGEYWLWKLLSGSSITSSISSDLHEDNETMLVLEKVLQIIRELEFEQSFYCANLNIGSKLYYLMNIFLSGKSVFAHDRIVSLGRSLFDLYFNCIGSCDLLRFAEECLTHSEPIHVDRSAKKLSSTNEKEVEAILYPFECDVSGFSTSHLRALGTFVGDLCDAYLDFGFHFPLFTQCVRLFLMNGFPAQVRCWIIQRLRGVLHLLTVDDDEETMAIALPRFVSGGLPSIDQSNRDDPSLIDCVTSIYTKGSITRPDDLFVKKWAICLIARSLAISFAARNSSSLSVAKRRIESLEPSFATQVVLTAAVWLSSDGSLRSLVSSTLLSDSQREKELPVETNGTIADYEFLDWDGVLNMLVSVTKIGHLVSKDC